MSLEGCSFEPVLPPHRAIGQDVRMRSIEGVG
jgi:hypothetical protein